MNSNSEQGDRSLEEKAFELPVSVTTCGNPAFSDAAQDTLKKMAPEKLFEVLRLKISSTCQ